ncbi:MAG: hypothetical protein JWO30_3017 [Fibrobacteres bacterium]|nr:hypothetical protein [Fibrobacterota bacterium]
MKKKFLPRSALVPLFAAIATLLADGAMAASQQSLSKNGRSAKSQSSQKSPAAAASKLILDTATVRRLYLDGEFEGAIEVLEAGLKEKRPFDHKDSVFIFKHLGVMYAAKYETREKGKYYMHELLMTEPTARIMDMYASDMIYMIFKNIQDEFEANRVRLTHAVTLVQGNTQTEPVSNNNNVPEEPEPKRSHRAYYWIGATSIVVVAGVAAFFLLSEKPTSVDHSVQ